MSEYQYFEFQAIDRRLTEKQMKELRAFSSRAKITPTSFVNEYEWGDFGGDEDAWMEKYFDALIHYANWGTHVFKLGLPASVLEEKTAKLYCVGALVASVYAKNGRLILSFVSQEEGEDDFIEEGNLLGSLIAVRDELACGDLRVLYLAWLLCAQDGELEDEAIEPPVPPGLAQLSRALESFVAFLRIDPDLVAAAATASPPLVDKKPGEADIRGWLAKLPVEEKNDLLARLMAGEDSSLAKELTRRMRIEFEGDRFGARSTARRRSVAELRLAGDRAADERERIEDEKEARAQARRDKAAARARAKHLDQLTGKEPTLWAQVDSLVAVMKPKEYDQAVALLEDLRDLAARGGRGDFPKQLEAFRTAHASKRTFIGRMSKSGL